METGLLNVDIPPNTEKLFKRLQASMNMKKDH